MGEATGIEYKKWISNRDTIAEESGKEFEGGTMQPLAYTSSLDKSIKERCYELVNKYVK